MAGNFETRLQKLKTRRQGPQGVVKSEHSMDGQSGSLEESYQKRSTKTATTYTLGAMQEVDPAYTANSFAEGDRVKNQLEKALDGVVPVEFDYQGSVPLNIHIKGVSDIDLLLLRKVFVLIDKTGPLANSPWYSDWEGKSGSSLLAELRTAAEGILSKAFPEAQVDISGSKAITISGGSLRREVDVIPSHWYDSSEYQRTLQKKDRGIYIFLKEDQSTARNYPFLHMYYIEEKDKATLGNTKKVIRLLKTLVADYEEPESIHLSSYDIASLVWHFDSLAINVPVWRELSLLWSTRVALADMIVNDQRTRLLITPDKTRKIIDKEVKFTSLRVLLAELDDLIAEVVKELNAGPFITHDIAQRTLLESFVPS
ncbi:hypothetical protein [Rhizobium leguminosarum]|uniref:hypothetical protein n=1 Tax=Rhizobium leguminosarum TaxID=384 RepID=UPI0010300A20|nr:hypothetical protein [Rhizobium leguminosarum]TAY14766.1 hypothetical protein ELH96_24800 [Rhizobium leguminosarum]